MKNRFSWMMMGPLRDPEPDTGGGGGGGVSQADLDKFKAELQGDLQTKLNGLDKALKKDLGKLTEAIQALGKQPGGDDDDDDGDPPPVDGGNKDPVDPKAAAEIARLKREAKAQESRLKALEDGKRESDAKAQKATMDAAVRSEIAKYPWREGVSEDVFDLLSSKARVDEDGNVVAGPADSPVLFAEYLKSKVEGDNASFAHWLAPKNPGGGSGTQPGGRGGSPIDTSKLSPNADKATWDKVAADMGRAVGS